MNFYDLALIKKEKKIIFDVFYCSLRFYLPKVIFNANVCFFNAYVHCLMNRPFYQREYSSKPLKQSIVKRILVF